ncbi:Outer membrane receptor proteins, mostly Fe transport [Roseateles sp. YR242]|uniref:TonB-dependent receptor n=1 Tax=Roseateles sp. YR242 TaxID=1855305 RepID=UPI0008D5439F|nr:TonB-dependent receptor [Roseateles sp. YR242]SEL70543.1 Outer membrane receptor proteins, mostly Fe transport [Roseateles sp. YR242]
MAQEKTAAPDAKVGTPANQVQASTGADTNAQASDNATQSATLSATLSASPSAATSGPTHSSAAQPRQLATVNVSSRARLGDAQSASEGELGVERLAMRPLLRPAELLEAMPGMTVTQHSGDGKANQYFLRGFNLDHGSDFATFVMGMPVNMVTHAHGQGYMDLNFLMPELVDSLVYRKGAFSAQDGDFATTGAARIGYVSEIERPFVQVTAGPYAYRRAMAAGSTAIGGGWTVLGAVEGSQYDGPWVQPEDVHRRNVVLRLSRGDDRNGLQFNAMAYSSSWMATDHVPERAITSGEIDRYGALQDGDGGRTHRRSLSTTWFYNQGDSGQWRADAWAIDYGLDLFSNFSGYISGADGDQAEQFDERRVWGGSVAHQVAARWLPANQQFQWGLQWRHDKIDQVGLYQTVDRERVNTVRQDRVTEDSLGLYGELTSHWTGWLRSVVGLRWDTMRARVTPTEGEFNLDNGGRANQSKFSPKLGLIARVATDTELYAHWARAFRSNDARGATTTTNPQDGSATDRLPLMAATKSTELGLRTKPLPQWTTSLALWRANLDSELVFVGDEGVTEPRGASRRLGLEWSNDVQFGDWLIDADAAWSRARFVESVENEFGSGRDVPNAVPVSASLSAAWQPAGPWSSGVKLRYIGAYALEETGRQKSRAAFTVNWRLGYRFNERWSFGLDVLNLFDVRRNDIEYWGASCTRAEGAGCNNGEGINGRLVHPMEPRTFRLSLRATL